jgi:hypothetical protein
MKTRYLCEPSVTTDNSISMYLIKLFTNDIKHNYEFLEVSILLEEMTPKIFGDFLYSIQQFYS